VTGTIGAELEVFVVEDHLAVRKGIELLLRGEGMRVAGVASDVAEARQLLARRRHDVALIDLNLNGGSGLELVRQMLERDPAAAVVLYTGYSDPEQLREAMLAGARGFVLKSSPPTALLGALRRVAAGGSYVDPDLAALISHGHSTARLAKLSPREREILELLAEGLTGEEVASRLHLSPETVRTHVRNATGKLGAKTRVQAVALVVRAST
jgi:DNA-binding NarL/FixJ family response regulator